MPNMLEGYRTQSLYEASFLLVRGFRLAGREQTGRKVTIIFEPDTKIDGAVMEFYNGGHTINGEKTFEFLHRHLKWPGR